MTKAWTELGLKIEQTRLQVRAEEQVMFRRLRDEVRITPKDCLQHGKLICTDFLKQVINSLVALRHNGAVLDELDIATSFATLAHEKSLTRPILNEGYEG